jgi:hypothetical protein
MPEQKKVSHWKQGDYKHLTAEESVGCNKRIRSENWGAERTGAPPLLKTETDPVSETLCFLFVEIRTMEKIQKLNSNECYIPSSEPFRMYLYIVRRIFFNSVFISNTAIPRIQ